MSGCMELYLSFTYFTNTHRKHATVKQETKAVSSTEFVPIETKDINKLSIQTTVLMRTGASSRVCLM